MQSIFFYLILSISVYFKFGKFKPLHSIFFDLVQISSKSVIDHQSFGHNQNNLSTIKEKDSFINLSSNQLHGHVTSTNLGLTLNINEFSDLVLKSVAYCLCPGFNQDSFNF